MSPEKTELWHVKKSGQSRKSESAISPSFLTLWQSIPIQPLPTSKIGTTMWISWWGFICLTNPGFKLAAFALKMSYNWWNVFRVRSLKGTGIGLESKIFIMCIALQGKSRIYEFSQRMVTSVAIERILEMLGGGNRWRFRDGGVLKFRTTNIDDVSMKAAHRLSQDNGYNVMVAVVGCVGLDFSIFLNFLGLAKMGLVQDSCKCDMYSGVGILPL